MVACSRIAGLFALALVVASCGKKHDAPERPLAASDRPNATQLPAPVKPPAGEDWTQVVTVTPEGGFRMGNPNAKVHVVEYASLTCPHCAEYSAKDLPTVEDKYVKTGLITYELRNYLRDSYDLTAVLLSRCAGPDAVFELSRQIWAAQPVWEQKAYSLTADQVAKINAAPEDQRRLLIAQATGLDQFVEQRGVPAAKVNACLNDKAALDSLDKVQNEANADQIQGTPSFLINGQLQQNVFTWEQLEPLLKQALAS